MGRVIIDSYTNKRIQSSPLCAKSVKGNDGRLQSLTIPIARDANTICNCLLLKSEAGSIWHPGQTWPAEWTSMGCKVIWNTVPHIIIKNELLIKKNRISVLKLASFTSFQNKMIRLEVCRIETNWSPWQNTVSAPYICLSFGNSKIGAPIDK